MKRFVFDLETTGIDPAEARIVSVGWVIFGDDWRAIDSAEIIVDPGRDIPAEASRIHGITNDDTRGKPPWATVGRHFLDVLRDVYNAQSGMVAGYNARAYDAVVVNNECERHGIGRGINPDIVVDPLLFARWEMPKFRGRALGKVYSHFFDRNPAAGAHGALVDCGMAGRILRRMTERGWVADTVAGAMLQCRKMDAVLNEERRLYGGLIQTCRDTGELLFGCGKHAGEPLSSQPDYIRYLLGDLTPETRAIFEMVVES